MKPYSFKKSRALFREAGKWIANGTQGTRQPLFEDFPTYVERARGCRMWDVDGNEFIDLLCSIGPVILGYAYQRVDDAARAMIRDSFQSSTNHAVQIECARLLVEMVPSAESVRFLKTGTEATTAAARLARHITGREYIARHGYHGWADMWKQSEGFPGGAGGVLDAAGKYVLPFDGTAEGLRRRIRTSRKKFAAVILCPADTRPFTTENYQGIVDAAHEHGALVIFDEIKTGFRTAPGGAQELLGVMPDLTTLSKGLANGYPLSAVVGKADAMAQWAATPTSGTFSIEALSIAAAAATLREIKEKNVVRHLWDRGQQFIDGLQQICRDHGMEEPRAYPDPTPSMPRFTWHPDQGNQCDHPDHIYFFSQCCRYGLFFCPWHVAFMMYSHRRRDIDRALEICDFVMGKTKRRNRTRPPAYLPYG